MPPRNATDERQKSQEQAHAPKPPVREEKVDDQNEEADNTGFYDRDEDMYNQDARVPTDDVIDGRDKEDNDKKDTKKVQRDKEAGE